MWKYFSELHPIVQVTLVLLSPILIVLAFLVVLFCTLFGISIEYKPDSTK